MSLYAKLAHHSAVVLDPKEKMSVRRWSRYGYCTECDGTYSLDEMGYVSEHNHLEYDDEYCDGSGNLPVTIRETQCYECGAHVGINSYDESYLPHANPGTGYTCDKGQL